VADDRCDVLCLDLESAEAVRAKLASIPAEAMAVQAQALADPTRVRVAAALGEAELCGCDLAWVVGVSEQLVSHHVRRLREARLVESRRDGRIVFHRLTAMGMQLLDAVGERAAR
jgi:ArsR family transcriptional regulator, lead/cadmium/zinc/bismuth-responsive transcriptional repressor